MLCFLLFVVVYFLIIFFSFLKNKLYCFDGFFGLSFLRLGNSLVFFKNIMRIFCRVIGCVLLDVFSVRFLYMVFNRFGWIYVIFFIFVLKFFFIFLVWYLGKFGLIFRRLDVICEYLLFLIFVILNFN